MRLQCGSNKQNKALTPGGAPIANVHPKVQARRSKKSYLVDAERVGWQLTMSRLPGRQAQCVTQTVAKKL